MSDSKTSQTAGDDAIQIERARDVTIKKRRGVLLLLFFTLCAVCTIVVNNEEYKTVVTNLFPPDSQSVVRDGLDATQSAIITGLDNIRSRLGIPPQENGDRFEDGGLVDDWNFFQIEGGEMCYVQGVWGIICPESISFFPDGDFRFVASNSNFAGTYTVIDSNSVKLEGQENTVIYDFLVSGNELKVIDGSNVMIFRSASIYEGVKPIETKTPTPSIVPISGCYITIHNKLVRLKEKPTYTSLDLVQIPPGQYEVFGHTFGKTWFSIEVGSRKGWIENKAWNIDEKTDACP